MNFIGRFVLQDTVMYVNGRFVLQDTVMYYELLVVGLFYKIQ